VSDLITNNEIMNEFHIEGGYPLSGTIKVSGAKNAALKLMAASLLTDEEVLLGNVPLIEDVFIMADVLRSLGAFVEIGKNTVLIKANDLNNCTAPYNLVNKMRASILVMGPLLAKIGRTKVAMPGGCKIGLRKIDFHIKGLEALGAEISLEHGFIDAKSKQLKGSSIQLDFPSVGATENLLMAAVLAEGVTEVKNAAREPELVDLANFLNHLGAKIEGAGTSNLKIQGVKKLGGGKYSIIADRIEAGTFLVAGALAGKDLIISDFKPQTLSIVIEKLNEVGVSLQVETDSVKVSKAQSIISSNIVTLPYPGFPTDLQGFFMTLLSLSNGQSIITENVFENRFLLAKELNKMGAKIRINGHRALVNGVKSLKGNLVESPDLRGGAALVVASLVAEGETRVLNIDHIDRGYENLSEKFNNIGAQIKRIDRKEKKNNKYSQTLNQSFLERVSE